MHFYFCPFGLLILITNVPLVGDRPVYPVLEKLQTRMKQGVKESEYLDLKHATTQQL